jgi:hypothetical protein
MESSAVFAVRCPKTCDRLSLLDEVSASEMRKATHPIVKSKKYDPIRTR